MSDLSSPKNKNFHYRHDRHWPKGAAERTKDLSEGSISGVLEPNYLGPNSIATMSRIVEYLSIPASMAVR